MASVESRIDAKLRLALSLVRQANGTAAPAAGAAASSAPACDAALQGQLDAVRAELHERNQEVAYWQARTEHGDSAQTPTATPLLRSRSPWSALMGWLSSSSHLGLEAVQAGIGLLTSVLKVDDDAAPAVWADGAGGVAATARVLARVLDAADALTAEAARSKATALLLGLGQSLCSWSLRAGSAATPCYLLTVQRLLEMLGDALGPRLLSVLATATRWLVQRLAGAAGDDDDMHDMHALSLNAAPVLGALMCLLGEAAQRGGVGDAPWRRDALQQAFDDSLGMQDEWPLVAYGVWESCALAGVGTAVAAPPSDGMACDDGALVWAEGALQVPLHGCGPPDAAIFADVAPMMV